LRPVSRRQRYDRRSTGRQQPRYGRHSETRDGEAARRERRRADRTAVFTGIVAVAALLVAGVGVWILAGGKDSGDAATPDSPASSTVERPPARTVPGAVADVGDCIRVDDASATDADIEAIDCADRSAVYRVGVRKERGEGGDSAECPGPNYVAYTEGVLLLCLMLNAREGDCFHESDRHDARVACDSRKANYRVGKIFAGTDDPDRCGEDAPNALTYPKPPLTICRLSVE
jgi:hypothetical protein